MSKPLIFAHRGGEKWPVGQFEVQSSRLKGADFIELDIRKTADDVLVVSHARSLTNGIRRVLVDKNSYRECVAKAREKLPQLEEIVEEQRGKIRFNLDLQQAGVLPELKKFIKRHKIEKEICIDSPHHEELEELFHIFPRAAYAYTFNGRDQRGLWSYRVIRGITYFSYFVLYPLWPRVIKLWAKRTPFIPAASIYWRIANKGVVSFFHDRQIPVYVWPVNRERDMRKMVDLKVDGIKTSKPELLKEVLIGISNS